MPHAGLSVLDTHTMGWSSPRAPIYDVAQQGLVKHYSRDALREIVDNLPFLSRHSASTVYARVCAPTDTYEERLWGQKPQPLAWTFVIGGTSTLQVSTRYMILKRLFL